MLKYDKFCHDTINNINFVVYDNARIYKRPAQ
jgi:hypothetical protein